MRTPSRRLRAKPAICRNAFERMLSAFGPRHWWPGRTRAEVIVGAVLTQNTSWKNVEKAIANLRQAGALSDDGANDFRHIAKTPKETLAELIRPAGYYNLKARRLKAVVEYFITSCDAEFGRLGDVPTQTLREELLATYGVGPETADSILLYALERRVFVIDAYTLRIGARHGWFPEETKYEEARRFFERSLERDLALYNEYHALLVRVGALHCKPRPKCEGCPLNHRSCGRTQIM